MITLDPSRRDEAIETGLKACEQLADYEDDYYRIVQDWNPIAICDGQKVIGVLISKGGFIHIAIIPEYRGRWASRRFIREALGYGTKTDIHPDSVEFVERLGFKRNGSYYEMR